MRAASAPLPSASSRRPRRGLPPARGPAACRSRPRPAGRRGRGTTREAVACRPLRRARRRARRRSRARTRAGRRRRRRRRLVGIGQAGPAGTGSSRNGEGHASVPARSEANLSLPGERLQGFAIARAQRLVDICQSASRGDRIRKLDPGQGLALEGLADRPPEDVHLLRGRPEVAAPTLPQTIGGHDREKRGAVLGREQVEGAAHRPGLDEAPPGEGAADLTGSGLLTPYTDGEFGRRGNLRLDSAETTDHPCDRERARRIQKLATHPPPKGLLARDRRRHALRAYLRRVARSGDSEGLGHLGVYRRYPADGSSGRARTGAGARATPPMTSKPSRART